MLSTRCLVTCGTGFSLALAIGWTTATCASADEAARDDRFPKLARQIVQAAGIPGGLIVHAGCGDGRLTAALRQGEPFLVQGLDTDAERVERARAYLSGLGVYGAVSAAAFDGRHLPYVDNLVNLLVIDRGLALDPQEIQRVLCPGGIAITIDGDGKILDRSTKSRPADTDEWTHFLHDPSGNPVAHDQQVGPPRRLQWTADPQYARSHEHIPSINAVVSSGGRIFYIADETPIASIRTPARWQLVARDAYNGLLLWERPIDTWYPHIVNWGATPNQLQRKLVAVDGTVYVTLGLHAPLSAVEAASGETRKVYENTVGTEEILCHQGILLLVVRAVTDQRVAELKEWADLLVRQDSPLYTRDTAEPLVNRLRTIENKAAREIVALDAETGRVLWKRAGEQASALKTLSLCAEEDRVFYQNANDTICLDLASGQELWTAAAGPLRIVCDGTVYCAGGRTVTALAAETGQPRWTQPLLLSEVRDAFVAGGSLWLGGFKPIEGKRGPSWGPYFATQRDLATGEVQRHLEPENPGHHHRCYANKATDRYILGGRRGTEFIDLQSGEVLWHSWARGVCRYGVMPCNGLLYVPPHACGCYMAAKLIGFNAMAAGQAGGLASAAPAEPSLQRGPAYEEMRDTKYETRSQDSATEHADDWPTFRADAARSGRTPAAVPAALRPRWQAEFGSSLTSPTIAGGRVFAALVDRHTIAAVDADSGREIWRFTAGARIDSPPTLAGPRAVFGCCDGSVYSLRASDGTLAWRLSLARPADRIVARGQLESVSPAHGSVLVQDGTVFVTAGRSSYLDGGIQLTRIDLASGAVLSKTPIFSPDPETGRQPPQSAPAFMPGARTDILSSDGRHVYLRDMVFDASGKEAAEGDPHLFALTGFLDDQWAHRSYWIFGTHCSISTGCSGRDKNLLYGRLLVFDDAALFGFGRSAVHWSNQLEDGPYRLFAVGRQEGNKLWERRLPIQVRAMVLAGDVLFAAGPVVDTDRVALDPAAGDRSVLIAVSAGDGAELARYELDSRPAFDGLAATAGRLYLALENGHLLCLEGKR